jgi:hypothetical protein
MAPAEPEGEAPPRRPEPSWQAAGAARQLLRARWLEDVSWVKYRRVPPASSQDLAN